MILPLIVSVQLAGFINRPKSRRTHETCDWHRVDTQNHHSCHHTCSRISLHNRRIGTRWYEICRTLNTQDDSHISGIAHNNFGSWGGLVHGVPRAVKLFPFSWEGSAPYNGDYAFESQYFVVRRTPLVGAVLAPPSIVVRNSPLVARGHKPLFAARCRRPLLAAQRLADVLPHRAWWAFLGGSGRGRHHRLVRQDRPGGTRRYGGSERYGLYRIASVGRPRRDPVNFHATIPPRLAHIVHASGHGTLVLAQRKPVDWEWSVVLSDPRVAARR